MRSDIFGRLLKGAISSIAHYEGKTAPIIEDELGQQIGVTGASIQRYKAGHLPPEPRTIEILAEAAVRRGYLNREWLQAFLRTARHPAPEKLLDRLCPTGPVRQRPPRIYENLPAPTYSQFIMRAQAFAEVAEGLTKRSAAVLLVGLGGNGKTSLAREVAACCLAGEEGAPLFDAAVWVSDKDRPGTTNLSVVLDEIARTLDYPGFTQFEHEEKCREVEQLLRRQRVLVVVDNFETITDGALLSWLLNLPEPSKALITTREYRREFRRSSWPVDLRGMTEDEARELIAERVRVLKIEQLIGDLSQLDPLLAATGGNPKAIEMTMGLIKYERRPLQQVVDDLYAARGELFDDLFARAWALLDEAARRVLMIMTFFPASVSAEALAATADVQGFAYDRVIERLADLALLDIQQADVSSMARYTLHPLVSAFARARLVEQVGFEAGARDRWVNWYSSFASKLDSCWEDLSRVEILTPEEETAFAVIEWVSKNQLYAPLFQIAPSIGHYYHVKGYWDRRKAINLMCIEAAHISGNIAEEVRSLAYHVQLLSKQACKSEAEPYIRHMCEIAQGISLPKTIFHSFQHAIGLYNLISDNLDEAQKAWQTSLEYVGQLSVHDYAIDRRWLALCLYRKGMVTESRKLFLESLRDATDHKLHRTVIFSELNLATIHLDQGELQEAATALSVSIDQAYQYQDRENIAYIRRHYARLHTLRGDLPAARASLAEAIDLFERLGMRRELAEAREELARLEMTIASDSEPASANQARSRPTK